MAVISGMASPLKLQHAPGRRATRAAARAIATGRCRPGRGHSRAHRWGKRAAPPITAVVLAGEKEIDAVARVDATVIFAVEEEGRRGLAGHLELVGKQLDQVRAGGPSPAAGRANRNGSSRGRNRRLGNRARRSPGGSSDAQPGRPTQGRRRQNEWRLWRPDGRRPRSRGCRCGPARPTTWRHWRAPGGQLAGHPAWGWGACNPGAGGT